MILPVEVNDALDALRVARERVGEALDAVNEQCHPTSTVDPLAQSLDAVSWSVERIAAVIDAHRTAQRMEDAEERHVECQTFPWVEDL